MKYDIKNLTLQEKIELLTGVDGWHLSNANGKLKQVAVADGPNGLRKVDDFNNNQVPATAMPSLATVANTWNKELSFLQGETIADECVKNDIDVLLAPGANIKRTPLCGRNFEYFSEDPFLAGKMARSFIEGVQSKNVGTSLKHFAFNNREYERFTQSSEVDERTANEIYYPAFKEAIKANPWTIMCSYNLVNGVYASENAKLLKTTLREKLGFKGVVLSDWGAVRHGAKAVKGGLDLRMPYEENASSEIYKGLEMGYITESDINEHVLRILELIEKSEAPKKVTYTKEERHQNAVKIASEGIILLKNDGILPLKKGKITVAGRYDSDPDIAGDGSAKVVPENKIPVLSELLAKEIDGEVIAPKLWYNAYPNRPDVSLGYKIIYQNAYESDATILLVGTGKTVEREGHDRDDLKLSTYEEELILNTAKVTDNVIVAVYAGSAVDMSNWIDKVKAVIYVGYAGEGVHEALSDIIVGKLNPSGKLCETFPLSAQDSPTEYDKGNSFVDDYTEKLFVGYRWYDSYNIPVLFPFGHGLSYSKFEYSNLNVIKKNETNYTVSFSVENTSKFGGAEVVQLYIKDVFSSVVRPEKELRNFDKIFLKAGEKKSVTFELTSEDFEYYSTVIDNWYVDNGAYEILIGASSRDIRLKEKIKIELPFETQFTQI